MIKFVALFVALFVSTCAHAFTCEEVIYAKNNWSQNSIDFAMKFASKADIAKGKACLNNQKGGGPKATVTPTKKPAPAKRRPVHRSTTAPKQVSAPPAHDKCYIVGDSIAVGTASHEGLSNTWVLTDCKVDAEIGISSDAVIDRVHPADLLVVSAGSNDPTNPKLVDNLEAIRAKATGAVLWIVPAVSKVAATDVLQVAAEHHDDTVSFTAGADHTHPRTYTGIITRVRADLAAALAASNPPVVQSTPQQENAPMSASWLIPAFAIFGAFAFTYFVGKMGIVPVFNVIVSWWNSGKADLAALEARVKALESKVGVGSAPTVTHTGATGAAA